MHVDYEKSLLFFVSAGSEGDIAGSSSEGDDQHRFLMLDSSDGRSPFDRRQFPRDSGCYDGSLKGSSRQLTHTSPQGESDTSDNNVSFSDPVNNLDSIVEQCNNEILARVRQAQKNSMNLKEELYQPNIPNNGSILSDKVQRKAKDSYVSVHGQTSLIDPCKRNVLSRSSGRKNNVNIEDSCEADQKLTSVKFVVGGGGEKFMVSGDKFGGEKFSGEKFVGDRYAQENFSGDKFGEKFGDKFPAEKFADKFPGEKFGDKFPGETFGDKFLGEKFTEEKFVDKFPSENFVGEKYAGEKFADKFAREKFMSSEKFCIGGEKFDSEKIQDKYLIGGEKFPNDKFTTNHDKFMVVSNEVSDGLSQSNAVPSRGCLSEKSSDSGVSSSSISSANPKDSRTLFQHNITENPSHNINNFTNNCANRSSSQNATKNQIVNQNVMDKK